MVYKRFREWSESGLLEKIFHELCEDTDLQNISIDSTYIKAHKASAGASRGAERGLLNPVGVPSPKGSCLQGQNAGQSVYRSQLQWQKHEDSRHCGRSGESD